MPVSSHHTQHIDQNQLALNTFRAHARELQRFLLHRVGNREVDDLSQEVFARLVRVDNSELIRSPLAYLLGIAAHVVREFWQRKQQQCVVFDSEVADSLCENPAGMPPGNFSSSPDRLELNNWLDSALHQLPPAHRAVLLLVKRDGLSYEEAAAATGLSIHTVEKYLVEARARVRLILMKER